VVFDTISDNLRAEKAEICLVVLMSFIHKAWTSM